MSKDVTLPAPPRAATQGSMRPEAVRAALKSVLDSPEFDGAARLQSFLSYVVDEALAGRGDAIRAKTILEDVYGRSPAQGDDPLAVVRVDAGRLRRRLAAFYDRSGAPGQVRIHIEPGGYCPRFEEVQGAGPAAAPGIPARAPARLVWAGLGALAGGALASAIVFLTPIAGSLGPAEVARPAPPPDAAAGKLSEVREALFSVSPTKLQAANLAADARNLMFPALDRERLGGALLLFERAVALDGRHYGGHAGAAQVRAIMAVTSGQRDAFLPEARASAQRAVELAPESAWAQSASALVSYAEGNCSQAMSRSARARRLGPEDLHVQAFGALIALFCGDFQLAYDTAASAGADESGSRLALRNTMVAALFHLEEYQAAVDGFYRAIRSGGPVSALNLAYLTAAYHGLGNSLDAAESLDLLESAWPGYPLDAVVRSLFHDPAHAADLLGPLTAAGWAPSSRN
ncbi:MAG: hypothetical protein AAGG09_06655 [Pseudomonadota bacterium]